MPKVSIIVPVYNQETYLSECVESILNQSLYDIELILVDDGSTDKSSALCDMYAIQDRRVKVIHKENGGVSSSRNCGLSIATGEYFAFVDSDDYVNIEMYEYMYNIAVKHNVPMVACDIKYFFDTKKNDNICSLDKKEEIINSHDIINKKLYSDRIEMLRYICCFNKIYRRAFFDFSFNEKLLVGEDENLLNTLFIKNYSLVYVDIPFYNYRQCTPNSLVQQAFSLKNIDSLWVLKERVLIFSQNNFKEAAIKSAKVFCNVYISIYFKAYPQYTKILEKKFKKTFLKILLKYLLKNSLKTNIRMFIFYVSPKLYRKLLGLKKK